MYAVRMDLRDTVSFTGCECKFLVQIIKALHKLVFSRNEMSSLFEYDAVFGWSTGTEFSEELAGLSWVVSEE